MHKESPVFKSIEEATNWLNKQVEDGNCNYLVRIKKWQKR